MNARFSNYVFEQAFHISLTRLHIAALISVVESDKGVASIDQRTANGLERRGLIERGSGTRKIGDKEFTTYVFKPTMAGVILYELLAEAGELTTDTEQREKVIAQYRDMRDEAYAKRVMRDHEPFTVPEPVKA